MIAIEVFEITDERTLPNALLAPFSRSCWDQLKNTEMSILSAKLNIVHFFRELTFPE
jgi:hypothetical protein